MVTETTGSYLLELPSNPRNIRHIEPYVNEIMRNYHITQTIYGNILISLTEAVTNAIIHGNQSDENKKVLICVKTMTPTNITFLISDEGNGFQPENLPDPTTDENLLRIGGRGVFLMQQLADQLQYTDHGKTLQITFKL